MRIYREDSLSTANEQAGRYQFTNSYTRQNSGSGTDYQGLQNYAAFLLGLPATTSITRASDYSEYSKTWGFFVQDDWRVNSKLTLNLGLRWEIETALTERNDKSVSGFENGYVQPIEGTVQDRYAKLNDPALKALLPSIQVRGGLMFAGVDGPSRLYETPKSTFLPRFGFAYEANSNDGKSWYNSGQFSLRKRFAHGYTLGVSYTYAKWEQATEYLNAADPEPTRMISDLDVKHRLSLSAIVELPFGKGRKWGSNASGLVNGLIGNWQIQGVYTYQSGFPVPFGSFSVTGGTTSGDLFYTGGEIAIDDKTTDRWFNTDAFVSILNDTANNATPVNHLRTFPYRHDDVRRDSINNIDLSLIKDVLIKGDVRLQLRAEFINAFNEAYFPQPITGATSTTFGQISASNQDNYARRAQIGIKLLF